jgi:hypothetical protein
MISKAICMFQNSEYLWERDMIWTIPFISPKKHRSVVRLSLRIHIRAYVWNNNWIRICLQFPSALHWPWILRGRLTAEPLTYRDLVMKLRHWTLKARSHERFFAAIFCRIDSKAIPTKAINILPVSGDPTHPRADTVWRWIHSLQLQLLWGKCKLNRGLFFQAVPIGRGLYKKIKIWYFSAVLFFVNRKKCIWWSTCEDFVP